MAENPLLAAMTAEADQALAECREEVRHMVDTYREILTDGRDATVATGMVVYANLCAYEKPKMALLLAVAMSMLADAGQADAVPGRSLLEERAVAYDPEDPNAPKGGA